MSRILVPDAGPLFSLAAGDLLGLLARFRVGITDIVREETIDRGNLPSASLEAQRLRAFYQDNKASIEIFPTQVGATIKALLSTQAFLEYAQSKTWIASAAQARDNIAQRRPTAYAASATLRT